LRPLLATLVVALALTSGWLWHELAKAREKAAHVESVVTTTRAQAEPMAAPPTSMPTPIETADSSSHDSFDQTRFNRGLVFSGNDPRLRKNAQYMEARRRYETVSFDNRYPNLLRVLNVSKDTALKIVDLSYEEQIRRDSLTVDLARDPDFWLRQQQKEYESDSAIAALIGEAKLKQWKEYRSSMMERFEVMELRYALIDSSDPLEAEKAESLIRTLYEKRRQYEEETKAKLGSTGGSMEGPTFFADEKVLGSEVEFEQQKLKAAAGVLSAIQLESYRKMMDEDRAVEGAMEELQRIGMEALK